MNCIVTGGAGFIGSHLADRLLEENHFVTILDNFSTGRPENLFHQKANKNLTLVEADVSNFDQIRPFFKGIDVVFHLAALADIVPSIVNPTEYYKSNVTGTLYVAEASRLSGVKKLIYSASSSCYGIPTVYPTPETADIDPQYPYALTKYLGEQIILHWMKIYKLSVVSLRLFNVFGPRQSLESEYAVVVPRFIISMLNNESPPIHGNGKQSRDFTYIGNVVEANLLAAVTPGVSGEVFNIASGFDYTVLDLVEYLNRIIGKNLKPVFGPPRPGDVARTLADISRAKKLLKLKIKVDFEQGLKKCVEWFKAHKEEYD